MLVLWDSFFILDFGFYLINGIASLNIKGDGFTIGNLHKDMVT